MTKQEFETLMKNGHITNTYAHKYLNDEESLKDLTVRDLFNMGLVTVTGLKVEEVKKVEETTVAPEEVEKKVEETTVAPEEVEKKVEESTVAPEEVEDGDGIVVDDGKDEE